MRKLGWFLGCGALLLLSVAVVEGQQEKKGKGGGGGFGGFGGFRQAPGQSLFTLLNSKDVKTELDVTEEQLEKLPDEVMVAIGKVLNEKQFKRFKQIDLQNRKNNAFKDTKVQTQLKMTDEQKKNIAAILADETKEIGELRQGGGGFGKGNNEKIETIRKDAKEKIYTVLTKEQRKTWRDMVGEEFKFTTPNFGGGFGGGNFKGKNKKKDTDQ
ncbi:MAG TPA: hypothetical protein VFE62_09055 [Gemmataceae bacterium]|nr:hypothetical protein [Gemmataceae bacterium]